MGKSQPLIVKTVLPTKGTATLHFEITWVTYKNSFSYQV